MSNINRINISLLKNYKNSFDSAQSKFTNTSYNTFNSSYLKQCSDPTILNMSEKLNNFYKNIEKGYSNISKWWNDYNSNIENLENYLSGNGQVGAITESCVRNYVISNLSKLDDYEFITNDLTLTSNPLYVNESFDDVIKKTSNYLVLEKLFTWIFMRADSSSLIVTLIRLVIAYILFDHSDDLTDAFIESLHLLVDGNFKDANTIILDALWTVDTGSTMAVGFNSILGGISKFVIGLNQKVERAFSEDIFFKDIYSSVSKKLFVDRFKDIEQKIKSDSNYNLTDEDCDIIINYYYTQGETITVSVLDALIVYFKDKNFNYDYIDEYGEILAILEEIKNSEPSVERQQAKFSTIVRLRRQSTIEDIKTDFYDNNFFGELINDNSIFKYDGIFAGVTEEATEVSLVYGAHIFNNLERGLISGLIPFADIIGPATQYEEGEYFSDQMGAKVYSTVADISHMSGTIVGMAADIGLGFLLGGTTLPKTFGTVAKVVDKTADGLRVMDKVEDAAKVAKNLTNLEKMLLKLLGDLDSLDNLADSVKAFDKALDLAKGFDNMADFAKNADKAIDYVRNIDKFHEALDAINKSKKSLKLLENGGDLAKFYDDIADALKLFDKSSESFKLSAKLTEPLEKLAKLQNFTKIFDNFASMLNSLDKAADIEKFGKKLDVFSKILNRFTKGLDLVNTIDEIDNVGDVFDKVLDATKINKEYKFKINLDDVPATFRESYEQYFNSLSSSIKMNETIGKGLEEIFDTDNYIIGIHKAGITNPDDILKGGLWLTGDSSSGVVFNGIDLSNNIVFENPFGAIDADFLRFCKNIEGSAGYKTVNGAGNAIIIKIPKADFSDISKLTFFDGSQYVLKNDYIVGYVKTYMDDIGNVIFDDIVYRSDITAGIVNSSNSTNIFDNISEILSDFHRAFNDGQSDSKLLNLISEQFENAIKEGNEDALITLKKLIDLKQLNPKLKFKLTYPSKDQAVSFYSKATDSINIMPAALKKESLTNFHELFHMIDYEYSYKYNRYLAPNNYKDVFDSAREQLMKNNNQLLNEFVDKYKYRWKSRENEANNLFFKKINQAGFDDFVSYRNVLINQYDNILNSFSVDSIKKYIDDLGIEQYIMSGKVDGTSLADADIAATLASLRRGAYNKFENSWSKVSDIVDAVLKGKIVDDYCLAGHGAEYYSRIFSDFKETIANFGALKVGAPERLDDVKYFLGEEFYQFMEHVYNLRIGKKVIL